MNLDTEHVRPKAVVLLSGGLDSATVAALAQSEGYDVFAISFDYGQRHKAELVAANRIASHMKARDHKIIRIDLNGMGGSALTDESLAVPDFQQRTNNEVPITYVPARNLTFLSFALGWAEVLGARHIFIGVNAVDYSGYPDCRPEFIAQFERVANLATAAGAETAPFRIIAPLQYLTKAQIIQMGARLGVDYRQTVSCYNPDLEGRACGRCDACHYRRQGFDEAGLSDATVYQ
ncbi:MAG: 7-cyano-7-deazaguanine synthase QueC [Halothiobacillus sp.]|jgi:7-cyano-7-deazaguanine synthase|uniref:7-cyano-7-deazaguanine synthase QueC n=1 Tax=Halothiobacillus sp. TaxID=1891311 RepID=UPI002AD36258|nr:7-cyano-7-deazaguanine synthase QueC [Halothiobacillus sp.]MDA3877268.1 7-cyano-7-deazaguanine synthase QueC [Halothiobacillus sp.]